MLVLVLLGCQALASEMMDFEDATNCAPSICGPPQLRAKAIFEILLQSAKKEYIGHELAVEIR